MKLKEDKQNEAEERQKIYDKLSTNEKIVKLDSKLGKDVGATKQRARLNKKGKTNEK